MCGIVGYIGYEPAQPILIKSLKRLEYRGYDSCGIAILRNNLIDLFKDLGRIADLEKTLLVNKATIGIGHTRWATHGVPSKVNAHPHLDCNQKIAVVHNGVIENFLTLREQLIDAGHIFLSQTDTEVLPHLIESHYHGDLRKAVEDTIKQISGSFAIIVMAVGSSELMVARKESPIIIGIGDRQTLVASDIPAVLEHTDRVVYLEDNDVAVVTDRDVKITNDGHNITRQPHFVAWDIAEAEKSGYDHFMLKEIHEQPEVIRRTLASYASEGEITNLPLPYQNPDTDILLLGCGTSSYAGQMSECILTKFGHLGARSQLASEFIHFGKVRKQSWVIGLTQSGETADTLKAIKRAKEQGATTVAITNVVGSTVTRIVDHVLYTRAGPEISVAATKTFISQLVISYLLAMQTTFIGPSRREALLNEIRHASLRVEQILNDDTLIAPRAISLAKYNNLFLIARGINYPVALEGALKLKEVAYVHAEAYAAGELKHGPFALLRENTPVIAIVAYDETYIPLLTSIKEIKARNSPVLAIAEQGDKDIGQLADDVIYLPKGDPLLSPLTNAVALQLLAYHVARERHCSIDFPINLAKSVTVP